MGTCSHIVTGRVIITLLLLALIGACDGGDDWTFSNETGGPVLVRGGALGEPVRPPFGGMPLLSGERRTILVLGRPEDQPSLTFRAFRVAEGPGGAVQFRGEQGVVIFAGDVADLVYCEEFSVHDLKDEGLEIHIVTNQPPGTTYTIDPQNPRCP